MRLMGGLGNQMFQYALGRRLASDRHVPLKLDLSWFSTQNKRKFELCHLNTLINIASEAEVYQIRLFSKNRKVRKLFSFFQNQLPYYKRRSVNEQKIFYFDNQIMLVPKSCYLTGYWQSEKYFNLIGEVLRKEFDLKEAPDSGLWELGEEMQRINSVSLHVRRGDYISDPVTNNYHGVLGADYYRLAMKQIQIQTGPTHFYVFSDDLDWVKENMRFVSPCTFVEKETKKSDCEEMWLMSKCKHHIIANSSFSWWGAWLGINPDKIVISPKQWQADPSRKTPDLIPGDWIIIENE